MTQSLAHNEKQSLLEKYNTFFFKTEIPYGLAIIRIFLPLIIFVDLSHRWVHAREIFSLDGAPVPLWENYGFYNWLPLFSGEVVVALMTVLMFLLIACSMGWCTRFSAFGIAMLYPYFGMVDSVSTITKYVVICGHIFIILGLSNCGSIWSVDSWLKKRKFKALHPEMPLPEPVRYPVCTRRLIQLLIAIVYFGAAMTKLHTDAFLTGDQLYYWANTHLNYEHLLGEYLAAVAPVMWVLGAYSVIVFQILFLFLVWRGRSKCYLLGFGLLFHVVSCFALGLYVFPTIFCLLYMSFLEERNALAVASWFVKMRQRFNLLNRFALRVTQWKPLNILPSWNLFPRPVAFATLLCLIMVVGVEAEYQMDPYDIRRPEGPHQLVELDNARVNQLLNSSSRLRIKDTVLDLQVGSVILAELLVNSKKTFQTGETAVVQASFNPPHSDMWVECNLYDSEQRLVRRQSRVLLRKTFRLHYHYAFDSSLEPGEYYFELESAGNKLIRRKFTLQGPAINSPVAN